MRALIRKERSSPIQLEALHAAVRRLPDMHLAKPAVEAKLIAVKSGFGGERQLDKVFDSYRFSLKHQIFNDLSLYSSTHFQIDTLFVTPSFAIVFEVKNIAGELSVVENPPQLIRTLDTGKVSGFKSPVDQVLNNCELLQDWFHSRQITLPIYGVVVLAYAKNPVKVFDTPIPFLYPSAVPRYIRSHSTGPQLLDEITFSKLCNDLLLNHQEYKPHPISTIYSIAKHEIKTGVHCTSCGYFGMTKYIRGWRCGNCNWTSINAHEQAISDWFHLFGGKMTNKDCRAFLHLDRQQTAYRIMKNMNMTEEGAKRNRTYTLDLQQRRVART